MAFAIIAIVALLAVSKQASADPIIMESAAAAATESNISSTTTTTKATIDDAVVPAIAPAIRSVPPAVSAVGAASTVTAVNSVGVVNSLYNSPYIPSDDIYSVELLKHSPYYMYCDCDFSSYLDPAMVDEVAFVSSRFNQRQCDIQQWDRIIQNNMPGIDSVSEANMLSSLASSVQREQLRRDLVYAPSYPEFCLNYARTLSSASSVATSSSSTVLVKREPMVATSSASSATSTTTSTTATANPWVDSPYYYSMQYLFERSLPHLSPDLKLDIINSIMANTPPQYWNMAYPLAQQLTSNVRGMVSEMVDLS